MVRSKPLVALYQGCDVHRWVRSSIESGVGEPLISDPVPGFGGHWRFGLCRLRGHRWRDIGPVEGLCVTDWCAGCWAKRWVHATPHHICGEFPDG